MGASSGYTDEDDAGLMTDINITPLVDVVLVLLIVFLMTVPSVVGSNALKINLPEAASGTAINTTSPWELVVRIEEPGQLVLYLNGERTSREDIDRRLNESGSARNQQEVRLAGDKGVPYGEMVKVMDMLAELKLVKLSLRTKLPAR